MLRKITTAIFILIVASSLAACGPGAEEQPEAARVEATEQAAKGSAKASDFYKAAAEANRKQREEQQQKQAQGDAPTPKYINSTGSYDSAEAAAAALNREGQDQAKTEERKDD